MDTPHGLAGCLGPSILGFAGAMMLVHDFEPRSMRLLSVGQHRE
ncbi:MAG TPA: hypothetical protein VGQ92_25605 [Actinoplanes sp.]|jgi:hypothetical protein|nr:hypothetical protein [Actinoplanes sp.]